MSIEAYLKHQSFFPGFVGIFTNPFFFARKELVKHISICSSYMTGDLLDVGCGKKPYKVLFRGATKYVGMDIENPGHDHSNEEVDVYYDGTTFPFEDNSFDSVLTNQVFEHVFNPSQFLSEIHRVLKPGGYLLLTVPFVWDEHEQPIDFGRYSSFGIRSVLDGNGLKVIQHYKSGVGIMAVFQLFNLHIFKKFYSRNRAVNMILTVLLISPFNILGSLLSIWKKKNSDLFLDNVVLARNDV